MNKILDCLQLPTLILCKYCRKFLLLPMNLFIFLLCFLAKVKMGSYINMNCVYLANKQLNSVPS